MGQFIFNSLIQSDYGDNLEALILFGGELRHFWCDYNAPGRPWKAGVPIPTGGRPVAFPASLIQSSFGDGHGNFEAVVPLATGNPNEVELWHFWRDNADAAMPWRLGQRITEPGVRVAGPASIIQSSFGDDHGNFEVVVPLFAAGGQVELWHYFLKNYSGGQPWQRGQRITGAGDRVGGPGSIIQSNFGGDHGNFEVVVPLAVGNGLELRHFFHDNSDVNHPWQPAGRITDNAAGPASIIQSTFNEGNFEVVGTIFNAGRQRELWHFFYDKNSNQPWQRAQLISAASPHHACIIQSKTGSGEHGNFEALTEECDQTVVHYWHPNQEVKYPWLRASPVLRKEALKQIPFVEKIAQLTGEYDRDRKYWDGKAPKPKALNQTETNYDIRGTDLGASFKHKDRTYFLFGDTWRVGQSEDMTDLDSVALTVDICAKNGLRLHFLEKPPRILGGDKIEQHGFNVPLDGFSLENRMFVFFSSNKFAATRFDGDADPQPVMGRSVVAESRDDGYTFQYITDISRVGYLHESVRPGGRIVAGGGRGAGKFINVSVELVLNPAEMGLPAEYQGLFVWGSGRYRSSDVYLAFIPLAQVFDGSFQMRYLEKVDELGNPHWADDESAALALTCNGSIGELCIRWNPFLSRWLMTYNNDNPSGILLQRAVAPWGKWSDPVMLFNARATGAYRRYIHVGEERDLLEDQMFGPNPFKVWGDTYGPYQIASYTTGKAGEFTKLYFTLSLWNPYQVIQCSALLAAEGKENVLAEVPGDFDGKCPPGCLGRLGGLWRRKK